MKKYRYLRGKLLQLGIQHGYIAKKFGLAESSFSARMRGKTPFRSDEMWEIMKIIDAPAEERLRSQGWDLDLFLQQIENVSGQLFFPSVDYGAARGYNKEKNGAVCP